MASRAPPSQNLYEILGLPQTASRSEIRAAYYQLAKQSHPDKNPGADPAIFHTIQHAYETLSDPERRAEYDSGALQPSPATTSFGHPFPSGPMFENLFTTMFSDDLADGFFGPSLFSRSTGFQPPWAEPRQPPKWSSPDAKSPDARINFVCSLEDLMAGRKIRSELTRQVGCKSCKATGFHPGASLRSCRRCAGKGYQTSTQTTFNTISYSKSTCSSCAGTGSKMNPDDCCSQCRGSCITTEVEVIDWEIQRGMLPGELITLPCRGNVLPGHLPGDVVICLSVAAHPLFQMISSDSRDLLLPVSITLSESLLGLDRTLFRHLDGRDIRIYSPPPHQPGHKTIKPGEMKVIRGLGLPGRSSSEKRGDLYVKFDVEWPSSDWIKAQNLGLLQSVLPPGRPDFTSPQASDLPQEYANLEPVSTSEASTKM